MPDDDYSEVQNPGSGYGDVQDPPSAYANKNAKTAPAAAPKGKAPGPNGEVTILASYGWNPPISEADEVKYLLAGGGQWHPQTADYEAITGAKAPTAPGDFARLMEMIGEYQAGSIKRLNFWTHADSGAIGMTGYLTPGNVWFTNSIDEAGITNYNQPGISFGPKGKAVTLDEIRGRFTNDAIFVLYGCNIGRYPKTMLSALKDLLQVSIIGFKTENVYCPPPQTIGSATFVRKGEKIGVKKAGVTFDCKTDSTTDWRGLINDPNAVKVAK
jgi:hypothetical protein